jgi:hypothetical protein
MPGAGSATQLNKKILIFESRIPMPVNGAELAKVVYPLLVKIAQLSAEGSGVLPQLCPNQKRTIYLKN